MKSLTRIILILPQFFLYYAQTPKSQFVMRAQADGTIKCSMVTEHGGCEAPPERPGAILMKWTPEQALYKCPDGYKWSGGSRVVRCSWGEWNKLTMLCRRGAAPTTTTAKPTAPLQTAVRDTAPPADTVPARVTCAAPTVPASVPGRVAREHKVGAVLSVQCRPGFTRNGAEKITCGSDGAWQPTPPVCVPERLHNSSCGAPDLTHGSNAHLAGKYVGVSSFTDGARVHYLCDVGHVYRGGSKYRRCDRGRWSPLQLQCKRRLCGSAGELLNGRYEYSGVEFGDRATAVCDKGFQLVGQGTRNCLSRGWDGHPPLCEALVCDDPPEVSNAVVSNYADGPFEYRTVVSYRCLVGTLQGPADIWCTESGTWSSPLPECRDVTCADPNIPNASWVRSRRGRYQYREPLYVQCDPEFTLVGASTITCDERGQWAPELPKCKRWNMRSG